MPRQLRIQPDETIVANREISRIEHSPLNKIQYRPIDLWPLGLH